jgi:hypothetical protein
LLDPTIKKNKKAITASSNAKTASRSSEYDAQCREEVNNAADGKTSNAGGGCRLVVPGTEDYAVVLYANLSKTVRSDSRTRGKTTQCP